MAPGSRSRAHGPGSRHQGAGGRQPPGPRTRAPSSRTWELGPGTRSTRRRPPGTRSRARGPGAGSHQDHGRRPQLGGPCLYVGHTNTWPADIQTQTRDQAPGRPGTRSRVQAPAATRSRRRQPPGPGHQDHGPRATIRAPRITRRPGLDHGQAWPPGGSPG
jgi:hypothetical protein